MAREKEVRNLLPLVSSKVKRQVGKAQELTAKSSSLRDESQEAIREAKAIIRRSRDLRQWLKRAA